MGENLFTKPKSFFEIALDQVAFQNWLSDRLEYGLDDATLTREEIGDRLWQIKQNEKQLNRRRARWIARARDKDKQITADLKVQILAQRAAREGSPILLHALQVAGENLNPKHYRGEQCSVCGSRVRYISNGACVDCTKRHNRTIWGKRTKAFYRASKRGKDRKREREAERLRTDPAFRERERARKRNNMRLGAAERKRRYRTDSAYRERIRLKNQQDHIKRKAKRVAS